MTYDLLLEVPNSVLYLDDLLDQPVCRLIPAELDVGPLVPVGEPRLGHLGRGVLVPDGVLEVPDHALNLRDLVNSFLEVCLQFPEDKLVSVQGWQCYGPGGLLRLCHPVGESLLDPVCLLPQVLAGVGESAADDAPQPDAGLSLLLGQADVVVREGLPVSWETLGDVV